MWLGFPNRFLISKNLFLLKYPIVARTYHAFVVMIFFDFYLKTDALKNPLRPTRNRVASSRTPATIL